IAVLLCLNVALLAKIRGITGGSDVHLNSPDLFMHRTQIPSGDMMGRDGAMGNLGELIRHRPLTMLIFFSPNDCPTCFSEKTLWARIYPESGIPVYGIASHSSPDELWRWTEITGITVPMYVDTSYRINAAMAFERTPLKVLVDSTGYVIWADPFRDIGKETDQFWSDFAYVLDKERNPSR
ncbi:MAG: hypothetical protein PHR28_13615, partial [candidate division Zixibacteria bacterium]|nr:hypothetical protein [candidate division Zixibacteria bacterium]